MARVGLGGLGAGPKRQEDSCDPGQRQLDQWNFRGPFSLPEFLSHPPTPTPALLSNPLVNFVPSFSKMYLELAPAPHPIQCPIPYYCLA